MANSILANYVQREAEMKRLQEQLEKMQNDPRLQNARQFQSDVTALMEKYEISADDAVQIIKPELAQQPQAKEADNKPKRRLKVYTNPHTGEKVETRGGNHKTIKEWKAEYGDEEVNGWAEFVE